MEALKAMVAQRKATTSQPVTLRGEAELEKREEYLKQQATLDAEKDARLGKRLKELGDFLEESKMGGQKEMFEPMKKVITHKKKNKKTEKEEEDARKILEKDTAHRDVQSCELELTEEMIVKLLEHNKEFEARKRKAEELKVMRPDLAVDIDYAEQCSDVHVWVTKTMRDWEHTNLSKPRGWENTLEGKTELQLFRETKRIFWNLYETLVMKTCNTLMLNKYYHIAHYCLLREYVCANDNFMDLSIGNAPWPIGVTMVGIHERSGRAKIFTSQIAHIMNDESQKQIVLNMKRLITFSQKKYPTNPSKMVLH
jgi:pre-mRNA-splicing factor 18